MSRLAEILGVKDEEEFNVKDENGVLFSTVFTYISYRVSKNGKLERGVYREWKNEDDLNFVLNLINGIYKIVKPSQITKDERETLNYYAKKGYHWFAKDKSDAYYAYINKPIKQNVYNIWNTKYITNKEGVNIKEQDLSFLSWEDKEPFYWEGEK